MSEVTVRQFAEVVGIPVDRLMSQLGEAGLKIDDADATISDKEKMQLLTYLRQSHGKSTLSTGEPKKITLRRKSVSELRTKSSAGRGKTVAVEVRKKRTYVKRNLAEEAKQKEEEERAAKEAAEKAAAEEAARLKAEEDARLKAEEEAKAAEEAKAEEAKAVEVEEVTTAPEVAAESVAEEKPKAKDKKKKKKSRGEDEDEVPHGKRSKFDKSETKYGRQELHVSDDLKGRRKKGKKQKTSQAKEPTHEFVKPTAPVVRDVAVGETITVSELAQKMAVKAGEVIKELMKMGVMATINQAIDQDTAILVVEEMGHKATQASDENPEDQVLVPEEAEQGEKVSRPPVITVMGHVDHGKTSLLDYIRTSQVADGEAGGITQHIGAYQVHNDHGELTFIDTPGHAAFTAMRARGAKATDIVVLVVAADDGVMPQTIEAIQHARAAEVPIIVAVNKIDKEEADPDRVKNELAKHEVIPEDWGGDTQFVHVSAKSGEGIDELIEALALLSEVLELKAVKDCRARGVVLESSLDKGRGPVATILVQEGTLKQGDILLSGSESGRVRAMFDENGHALKEAGPSTPVLVLGLSGTPEAGDDAFVVQDDRKAREIAEYRAHRSREHEIQKQHAAKLQDVFTRIEHDKIATLNLMVKADVQGSSEALRDALEKLSTDEVRVKIIATGVGGISESDVQLALASNAVMIAFNVRADGATRQLIQREGLDVRYYSVIYDVIDDVRKALTGLLGTEIREQMIGLAEVRDVFRSSKYGAIAGCLVTEGVIKRENPIRVLRDNVVIFEGALESLRRFKDDVKEVQAGTECGIGVKDYNDIKSGDQIEVYERIEVERTL